MVTLGDKKGTFVALLKCDKCEKIYKNRTGLWRHKNKGDCTPILLPEGYASATFGNTSATTPYQCNICNKQYIHRQGLWRHNQKYHKNENKHNKNSGDDVIVLSNEEPNEKQLIMMLIRENSDLRKEQSDIKDLILEIVKNGTYNITNNAITTNSNNKAFNLNFFLNETCKNAMNITDFVDSITLQLSDFMEVGELGYVEGISNIIVKKLNALDETIRPIHCTDQKRETFYVKDDDKWEKEEEDKTRIKKLIRKVSYKNENLMKMYKEMFPDYNNPESKRSDQYSKLIIEAMDCKEENKDKIIKNISKATAIKKVLL